MTERSLKLVSVGTASEAIVETAKIGTTETGGGNGGGGKGMDPLTEERIKRSEAETRIEIVRLEGKIDQLIESVKSLRADTNSNKWQLIALGLGVATLLIGVWAFQTQLFGFAADTIAAQKPSP